MKFNLFSFLVLSSMIVFSSCSKEETMTDADLIEAIFKASDKEDINEATLPERAKLVLNSEFTESYVSKSELAPKLGYQLGMRRGEGTQIGTHNYIYFDLEGRKLDADKKGKEEYGYGGKKGKDGCDLKECFELVFPITYIMPDGLEVSGADKEILWTGIKDWYIINSESKEKPALQYPVDIIFDDGTTMTIANEEALKAAYELCE